MQPRSKLIWLHCRNRLFLTCGNTSVTSNIETLMGTVGQHTPNWLSEAAFNDTFDWTKSIKTTFPIFFEYVTLHDSSWQTINLNVTNETILSIELDAFWNKEYTLKT